MPGNRCFDEHYQRGDGPEVIEDVSFLELPNDSLVPKYRRSTCVLIFNRICLRKLNI